MDRSGAQSGVTTASAGAQDGLNYAPGRDGEGDEGSGGRAHTTATTNEDEQVRAKQWRRRHNALTR